MDKENVKYYSVMKKKEILPFAATWLDLEGIRLREIIQTDKDKDYMKSFICGIKKRYNTLVNDRKKEVDSQI